MSHTHSGSCHCGVFRVQLSTQRSEEEITPRACGCDFCLKHRPAWFSDPEGQVTLTHSVEPLRYRFGTETADFLICPICGVVIAATSERGQGMIGVFNLNCLDAGEDWSTRAQIVDYEGEETGDRLARRAKNWMPFKLEAVT